MKKDKQPGGYLPDRDLLTTADLISYFRIAPRTLRRWVSKGWLVPANCSSKGCLYFKRADVERFIDGEV